MGYLEEWEKSVAARKGFSKTEKNKMLLSDATRSGLKFTGTGVCVCVCVCVRACVRVCAHYIVSKLICNAVKAFIEMVEYLFMLCGVKCFLSERISQDPLEEFFRNQRQRGGVNENPTARLE